jgi:transcriptional regulator with XRE-family HTH domain
MSQRKFRRRMSSKELPADQAKRVLGALQEIEAQEKGNRSAVARRLKMSQASISNLLNGKNSPSFDTATRIAGATGASVWNVLGTRPPDAELPRFTTHPNLLQALEIVGLRAVEKARSNVLAAAQYLPDLAVPTWISLLLDPAHENKA